MPIKIHNFDQYSLDWWMVRRGVPTASCFDSIITPVTGEPSKGMLKYVYELIGDRLSQNYGDTDDERGYQSAAMKNGTIMEPAVRAAYEFHTDSKVVQVGFLHNEELGIGCSPDGLVGDDGGLECKYPTAPVMAEWLDTPFPIIPSKHKPQVHGSLIVSGRKWWDFMAYHPGFPPLIVRQEPDDYTDKVRAAIEEFQRLYSRVWSRMSAKLPEAEKEVECIPW